MQKTTKMLTEAPWTTMTRNRWADGRVQGVDGSMWLLRAVPLGPVDDARSEEMAGAMAEPLMAAFAELSALSGPIRMTRRATAKAAYRDFKLLLVNMPDWFRPESPFLARAFPSTVIQKRVALLAVRLASKVGGDGGWRAAVDSIVETFLYGGTAVEEFNGDAAEVGAAMDRCGLRKPTEEETLLASAWWNRGEMPDVPYLVHADHLHLFRKVAGAQQAARLVEAGTACDEWPESGDTHTLSFATVTGLDTQFAPALSPAARWMSRLVEAGAVAISLTGKVEPSQVTRDELRRMLKRYQDDLAERYREGKMNRAEQEETEQRLAEVEAFYATGGTPTLMETSTIVAFSGRHERSGYDPTEVGRACGVHLAPMVNLQTRALAETMIASHVRANPHVRDFPCQTVAYSGLPSLSVVGDRDGVLVGFTERDKQPAYMAAMAATDADSLPLGFILGATGSGKSQAGLWLCDQFARERNSRGERRPVMFFDPKTGSDFSAIVHRSGGQVYSLDTLATADGVFDAIRFCPTPEVGVEMASSMLMQVNPWGPNKALWEAPLLRALNYGVNVAGARCTMQALELAEQAGYAESEMVKAVRDVADASPMFRALCGRDPQGQSLAISEGITYIKVGQAHLDLPAPGVTPEQMSLSQRVSTALVRAVAYGSMMAMTERDGVMMLDEFWVFTTAGATEMERIGRLARSQRVFPIGLTQRVSDALNIGLAGYISRGIILPIEDKTEAVAACELFRLDPTPERIARITAKGTLGDGTSDSEAPNWNSMRHLRDPRTRQVLRGSIGIYCDLLGRAVPVEVRLPSEWLAESSTNRLDIEARRAGTQPAAPVIATPSISREELTQGW